MRIKFRMAAWCAAAGRDYNEDNFHLKENLSSSTKEILKMDNLTSLEEKGALLVVCDGMGGMNAGEVASRLAIEAIQEQFVAERLTPQILETPESIKHYIEQAIIAADEKIKEDGKKNREHEGMGSTIVLAWIVGKNVYIGWCGDSRAYRFNPAFGLEQLSHDHSYVQELVDNGKLSPELAFDHPDSNLITRSLGDNSKKIRPEMKCFPLYNDDIILLCSDGLSGVLRDSEMEAIMAKNTDSMENCRKALWRESEKAGWNDNVTIALCQIVSGAETAPQKSKSSVGSNETPKKKKKWKIVLFSILTILFTGIIFEAGYYIGKKAFYLPNFFTQPTLENDTPRDSLNVTLDSIKVEVLNNIRQINTQISSQNKDISKNGRKTTVGSMDGTPKSGIETPSTLMDSLTLIVERQNP